MTVQEIITHVKDDRIPDEHIMGLFQAMDDDSEDLEAVLAAIEESRPELRMRLKETAAQNI